MKKVLYSRIKRYFPIDLLIRLNEITYADEFNTTKGDMIIKILNDDEIQDLIKRDNISILPLGSGTNRIGIQIGEYIFKFALDQAGKIDNLREMKYTDKLQPYVIKCYECTTDGLIMACEAFRPISKMEMEEYKDDMFKILKKLSNNFFIGDIGYDSKNYANWGIRKTNKQIGILDFAYIYSVKYQTFQCTCRERGMLHYDENYVKLICPECGRVWEFGEIRKRISKAQEKAEIGDLRQNNYVLTSECEVVEEHPEYTFTLYNESEESEKQTKKQILKEKMKAARERREAIKEESLSMFEEGEARSFDELIRQMKERIANKK